MNPAHPHPPNAKTIWRVTNANRNNLDRADSNSFADRAMGNQQSPQSRRQIEQQTLVDRVYRVCAADRGGGVGIGRTETHSTQSAFAAGQAVMLDGLR